MAHADWTKSIHRLLVKAILTVVQLWWTLDIQYILLSKLKVRKLKAMLVPDLFMTKCFRVPDLFAKWL